MNQSKQVTSARLPILHNTKTVYRIHVEGRIWGEDGHVEHTYEVSKQPVSRDEALKIAGDFSEVDKLKVEEVSTTTNRRLLPLK